MAKKIQSKQPLWLGGTASAMAACCTHPLDQTKYRMQVQNSRQPMARALYMFATRDGILSLWQGISASILRQATYSTARFGIYNHLAHRVQQTRETKKLSTPSTVACAGLAGGIAGVIGNPSEVVLVRMCADGAKAPAQRFAYANALWGVVRVGREEGLGAFFKGLGPNVVRSVLMNVSQIAVYTATKSHLISSPLLRLSDNTPTHILASLAAGTVATTMCAPADVLKSRLQSATATIDGNYTATKSHLLSSPLLRLSDNTPTHILASLAAGTVATTMCAPADVLKSRLQSATATIDGKSQSLSGAFAKALRDEGPRFLMKGWTPAWLRLAPNTVLMFIFMEQLQRLSRSFSASNA